MFSLNLKVILSRTILLKTLANFGCLLILMLVGMVAVAFAQEAQSGDVFPVPDTYKVEGVPPIKKSETENLFFDPSTIRSNLIWDSDSKNRKLLVTDEKNSVYLLNAPMAQPVRLTQGFVPNKVRVRPDGTSFAYTSDHENEDNYQLYLYDFKEKYDFKENSPKKLTFLSGKDESVDSFTWNKIGDSIFYTKVDYDTKTSKICQNNFSAETCFPAELKGVWTVVDADGDFVLLRYAKASTSHFLYAYDTKANKLAPLDEQGDVPKAFLFGTRAFWVSEGNNVCGNLPQCILVADVKNTKLKRLNLPENLTDFEDVRFSPKGANLLVQESKNGIDNLRVFRLKKDKSASEVSSFVSGSYLIWDKRWLSETEVAYTLENNGKPTSIHSYDIGSKKKTDWTKEKLPPQLEGKIKSPESIKWKSFDGKEISGYVVRPATVVQGKSPVLIYVHGGPQIIDKPSFNLSDIRLASNLGLTIIHTNIRGSVGFGKEFENADNREKRGDAVKDVQALIDWIEKQPDLDAKRILLRGESYGGFVVLSTALQEPTRVKGVIAEYPLVSIRGFLGQSWIDEFARNEYGDPKDEQLLKRLDELSPLNNTARWNNIPLFMTRGKLDERNPEKDVTDLKTQLQTKNSPVWFIYSTEDGHGFSGRYVTAAMFKFLKTQLNKEQ